jgi:hypothetical protein
VRINECRGGNGRVEEVAYSILPFLALCKKATMGAAYAAKGFGFVRAFEFEDLRDRAID